jgi:hypothetical protein
MSLAKLRLAIAYPQLIEIQIRFPIAVLNSYNGASNLDETWDDHLMPCINKALLDRSIHLKKAALTIDTTASLFTPELCYQLQLIAQPPAFDVNWIVDALAAENKLRGLIINLRKPSSSFEAIYQSPISDL